MGKIVFPDVKKSSKERLLWSALLLTGGFLIAEVVGGIITGSLALISDAAHMLTDVTALIIALIAIRISKRPADERRTFGYYRFEILAAAFNAALLFVVALYILFEAYQRLKQPPEIYSLGMLIIASMGLVVNLASMSLLSSEKDKSLNIKSAYLEVWSDMLGSLGVIAAALIIRFWGWSWVDSAVAVVIGLWVGVATPFVSKFTV
ncbi:cation efflux system protein [Legionella donaldsonii]|uniref:Cation efflux system protein n=1 Tax=Legionella donaldsonii TaxID=45060 RepID=A0A378KGZ4_9GAMM|nr:cation diffusion facilitator family transporter [Legionella donaldsonii]STX83956.1 cation efflux system protein [Legionella donaldsonii]